jgi:outer membrane lipoprotein SlyB
MMRKFVFLPALMMTVLLAGCASNLGGSSYYRGEARTIQRVRLGTLVAVRFVTISGGQARGQVTNGQIGTVVGGVAGGIAGSAIGGGRGAALATVGGVVLGAIAGHAIGHSTGKVPGVQLTVRLDSGRLMAVVQQQGHTTWTSGERVQVLYSADGIVRVQPLN